MASSNKLNLAITVNGQEVETTLTNLNKSFYKLRNSVNKLEEGTDEWIAANKELAKVERERERQIKVQKEYREEIKQTIEAQEKSVDVLLDFGENMSMAFAALKAGDMVAFQAAWKGIASSIGMAGKAALAFIATPVGAALAVLAGVALVTSKWVNYNKEIAESVRLTKQLTDFDGDELSNYRAAVQATADTFDKDFNEVLRSANSLSKQMGITQQEALDLINEGFIRGADTGGEFLKKIAEYPVQFKNAGYSAQDFIDIATQEAKGGIYDDKLIDALKEADLALKEMTKTQQDALKNAFGAKFANEIAKGVASGRMTTEDAINAIIKKSNEMGLNLQQKQQLVADVFKGAGEDAGGFAVIMEQLNQAFDDQNKVLDENEAATLRLVKANTENEQALAALFDASQSGFPAMLTNIKSIWQEIKTGVLVQLKNMFTSIEKLKEQAGFEGQSEAVKRIYENTKLFGTSTAEEAKIQIQNTLKNIETIKKKIEDVGFIDKVINPFAGDKKKQYEIQLSSAEKYLEELTLIAKDKSIKYQEYVDSIGATETDAGNGDGGQTDDEKKAAEERAKLALAEEQKRLDALQKLQEEYDAKTTERVEQNLTDKAEREKSEALAEAQRLGAKFDLIEQITAEHDLKIQEAKAEDKKNEEAEAEKELQKIRDFEARKQAVLDELELAQAETDEEKDAILQEQEIEKEEEEYEKQVEKFEKEMADLQLTEDEKTQLLVALNELRERKIDAIKTKYGKKQEDRDEEAYKKKMKLINDSLDAAINAAGAESNVGKGLLLIKQVIAAREMAIQLGLFKGKLILNQAAAIGNTTEGATKTASAGFPQNIPLLIGFFAQVAGIIAGFSKAKSASSSVRTSGFARGGFTDAFGQGYKDESGHEVAGKVHINEYVVPEFMRKEPEVPQILNYLEGKRKRKLGMYANGGEVSDSPAPFSFGSPDASMDIAANNALLQRLLDKLEEPIITHTLYDTEAALARQQVDKKLNKIQQDSKIKKIK